MERRWVGSRVDGDTASLAACIDGLEQQILLGGVGGGARRLWRPFTKTHAPRTACNAALHLVRLDTLPAGYSRRRVIHV